MNPPKKKPEQTDGGAAAPWKPDYETIIDQVSQSVGMTPMALNRVGFANTAVSTGILAYDLITGGGFAPGRWCGQYGPEASGKSTACASSIAQAQLKGIDSFFFDHEGSADPSYWTRIGVQMYGTFEDIGDGREGFSEHMDEESQELAKTDTGFLAGPHLRYFAPQTAEDALRFMSRLLELYPDKRQYDNNWYYVFKGMTQVDAKAKNIPYDLALTRKTGDIWVPAEDGSAQGMFYIDSLAFMRPEALKAKVNAKSIDWNDESGAQALLARVFSKEIPGVKAAALNKRFTIVATNQMREKPGVLYGNPEYAPGGNAVKHAHDNRSLLNGRPVAAGYEKEKGSYNKVALEPTWYGVGIDRYNFAQIKCEKSKDFSPHRECWVRWWFESNGRPGPGVDPVFDTMQYLKMTGQLIKSGKKYNIELPGFEQTVDYQDFKALILDPANKDAVRQACWNQLRNEDGFERYFDTPTLKNP